MHSWKKGLKQGVNFFQMQIIELKVIQTFLPGTCQSGCKWMENYTPLVTCSALQLYSRSWRIWQLDWSPGHRAGHSASGFSPDHLTWYSAAIWWYWVRWNRPWKRVGNSIGQNTNLYKTVEGQLGLIVHVNFHRLKGRNVLVKQIRSPSGT